MQMSKISCYENGLDEQELRLSDDVYVFFPRHERGALLPNLDGENEICNGGLQPFVYGNMSYFRYRSYVHQGRGLCARLVIWGM